MNHLRFAGIIVFVLVVVGAVIGGGLYVRGLKQALRGEQLDAANLAALLDSTREVTGDLRQQLGDTVRVFERRVFQGEVALELARRESRERGVALARLRVLADSLKVIVAGAAAVEDSLGVRVASDTLDARDSLGVVVAATVTVPPPPAATTWHWGVWRAPIDLRLELSCQGTTALARVAGPSWATLGLDSIQQDDTICVPPVGGPAWGWRIRVPSPLETALIVGAWEGVKAVLRLLTSDP